MVADVDVVEPETGLESPDGGQVSGCRRRFLPDSRRMLNDSLGINYTGIDCGPFVNE